MICCESKLINAPEENFNLLWDIFIDSKTMIDSRPVIDSH